MKFSTQKKRKNKKQKIEKTIHLSRKSNSKYVREVLLRLVFCGVENFTWLCKGRAGGNQNNPLGSIETLSCFLYEFKVLNFLFLIFEIEVASIFIKKNKQKWPRKIFHAQ